ncbi:MAG: histidinol-phosphatase [Actinobacteria bacterium]|nr:histidinol-phosphatase [Actinomycetota bacterium]
MNGDLDFALSLADLADSLSAPRFRAHDLVVETKPDLTPVTETDRAVEDALRERIARERPGEGVLGEERGPEGDASTRWIVDPIDGTKNYARGIPLWATLIALEREGELVLGVASAPALGRRWWAARGAGAFAAGAPIRVSRIDRLDEAVVSYTTSLLRSHAGPALELVGRAWHARTFSDFWQHMLVAEGAVEVAVESAVSLWDLAAVQVIVEEAGGRFTDLSGAARADGGSAVSSNGLVHEQVLQLLRGSTAE